MKRQHSRFCLENVLKLQIICLINPFSFIASGGAGFQYYKKIKVKFAMPTNN